MNELISTEDEILQLQFLLADWRTRVNLRDQLARLRGSSPEALTFAEVFTVTPNAILRHVMEHGWNSQRVQEVQHRPPDSYATAEYYIHPLGDQWSISSLADRGEWLERTFTTIRLARSEMVNMLLHIEWSGWNSTNRDNYLKERGQPLSAFYPPPPTVTSH